MSDNINAWPQKNGALKNEVYEKLTTELALYREWLLCKTKEEMLTYARDYNLREDIIAVFDDASFQDDELEAMLKIPGLLDKVLRSHKKDACCVEMHRAVIEEDFARVLKKNATI